MKKKYYRNKTAVITGAASGIGKEFAIQLTNLKVNLILSDINLAGLKNIESELDSFDTKIIFVQCDVTKKEDVENLAAITLKEMNQVDFVFSNAGVYGIGPLEEFTHQQWEHMINVNIWGMIYVVSAFLPIMLEQEGGHVIVTSSIAGSMGSGMVTPYSTTKFANSGFCEALYGEYKQKGLNVSVICPFPIHTHLIKGAGFSFSSDLFEKYGNKITKEAIEAGKKYYWEEFTKKGSGFLGGFNVEKSVKRFIKKISKKKLYIFDRRYGRLIQYLRGFWPSLYKLLLKISGKRHRKLVEATYDKIIEKSGI
ncbi:MAG: SDR family NAD(P)-dependent oxidoreductase [Candidatus Lokiarchaeota archaeon]|nr:SDR family NAD(P)-dependent oxidoreductase [Candidatus Lokiarchaeota archaeon]MBD3337938.1 SDR family NAD(P)-dependent oxidoreductase [Candidatus Lokiarchaeota archaeon]